MGKVLIRTNYRSIIFKFSTTSLVRATCSERRKLTELKPLLFSIMETRHGRGVLTPHLPALFEDWMTNRKSNGEILSILTTDIQMCQHIGRHTKTLLTELVNIMFTPESFAEIMELHSGAKLLNVLPDDVSKYLITNYNSEAYDAIENKFPEVFSAFDDVIVSGKTSMMKPQREIYELAMAKWNLEPQEVLYVDDDIVNIEAARELGFQTIHYTKYESALLLVKSLGDSKCRGGQRRDRKGDWMNGNPVEKNGETKYPPR